MHDSDKHCCKLCGAKTLPVYGYSMQLPFVIEFKACNKEEGGWIDLELRVCPKCGHIQGEIEHANA